MEKSNLSYVEESKKGSQFFIFIILNLYFEQHVLTFQQRLSKKFENISLKLNLQIIIIINNNNLSFLTIYFHIE